MKRTEIFVCLPNFSGGGAEKVMALVAVTVVYVR